MISVIIPVYNAAATVENALLSVKNQQCGEDFEVIVVDDGSTDDSSQVIRRFISENTEINISLITQENKGVSAARNAGLKTAHGDFIALLDADDEWLPEKTERQMNVFRNFSHIEFLGCKRTNQKILLPYTVSKDNLAEISFRKLMIRNETHPSSVIFKRSILSKVGFFDENQSHAEDANYWLRVSLCCRMYLLNESLLFAGGGKRTFGVSGLSADLAAMERGFQKNIAEMYERKRITLPEKTVYQKFYVLKYYILLARRFFHNL